jgi:hypothetical protein
LEGRVKQAFAVLAEQRLAHLGRHVEEPLLELDRTALVLVHRAKSFVRGVEAVGEANVPQRLEELVKIDMPVVVEVVLAEEMRQERALALRRRLARGGCI